MAFICEKIREEDREYFDSIGFTQILGEPSKTLWWVVDRENEVILISRGGMREQQYKEFQMFFEKKIINIRAVEKIRGDRFKNNLNIKWVINKIIIPSTLNGKEEKMKKISKKHFYNMVEKG